MAALARLPANVQAQLNEDHCEMLLAWSRAVALQPAEDAAQRKAHAAEALRILDGVPTLGVATRVYHLRRAELLTELGEAARADAEKQRAAAIEPNTTFDYFVLGLEANSRSDTETALAQFKKAIMRKPDHFWANYYLAGCQMKSRQYFRALEPLRTCIDQKPNFAWAPPPRTKPGSGARDVTIPAGGGRCYTLSRCGPLPMKQFASCSVA